MHLGVDCLYDLASLETSDSSYFLPCLVVYMKIAGVTTILAIVKAVLAESNLVVRFAQCAIAVALAILLEFAAAATNKHAPSSSPRPGPCDNRRRTRARIPILSFPPHRATLGGMQSQLHPLRLHRRCAFLSFANVSVARSPAATHRYKGLSCPRSVPAQRGLTPLGAYVSFGSFVFESFPLPLTRDELSHRPLEKNRAPFSAQQPRCSYGWVRRVGHAD